jgi:hypothetical protein
MLFDPVLLVTRPKYGLIAHWGVRFPDGTVYEYVPGQNLRANTDSGFAAGQDVTIVGEIPWYQAHRVRARLDELVQNPPPFDALTWNCESFAKWLTSGEAKSDQVTIALVLAGVVTLVLAATKQK